MDKINNDIKNMHELIKELEDTNIKHILSSIEDILIDLSNKVEEIIVKQEAIEENMEYIGDDLTDMREEMFEEVSFDELEDLESEYEEIKCKHCGKPLFVEKLALKNNHSIPCPFCNEAAK